MAPDPSPVATPSPGAPVPTDGLTGWFARVIDALGEPGVALLVALETVVPPMPSELVLAMAGYLASIGRVNLMLVLVGATVGSLSGALLLYWLGHRVGERRLRRWLDRIPLVDAADLDRADRWFERYGSWAVLFGRMFPVVRSLVSVPAGAGRMPLGRFAALTCAGSAGWNSAVVGAGYALGSRWRTLERYTHWIDLALVVLFGALAGIWVAGKLRRRASTGRHRP